VGLVVGEAWRAMPGWTVETVLFPAPQERVLSASTSILDGRFHFSGLHCHFCAWKMRCLACVDFLLIFWIPIYFIVWDKVLVLGALL